MGSAAFLVAACHFLARSYEQALVRDGECHMTDVSEADRAEFRRQVAQRCLYGVDVNPTAVQLARLSLWLATLSADKPLTFLHHRLTVGDSLIAASRRFFHWMLEFPELYFDDRGEPHANPGFDAVIGNPPWDMLRADSGTARDAARHDNAAIRRFIRDSGIYRLQGGGHVNRYQ